MAKETFWYGSAPSSEDCAQIGAADYYDRAQKECYAFINQLKREYRANVGSEFPGKLIVKSSNHDFGTYYEVAAVCDDKDEQACIAAIWLDNNMSDEWDLEAKLELKLDPNS